MQRLYATCNGPGCLYFEELVTTPRRGLARGTYGLVVAPGCVRDDRNEKLLEHGCTRKPTLETVTEPRPVTLAQINKEAAPPNQPPHADHSAKHCSEPIGKYSRAQKTAGINTAACKGHRRRLHLTWWSSFETCYLCSKKIDKENSGPVFRTNQRCRMADLACPSR